MFIMYLKISEVAKMLHVSPSPLYAAIHDGRPHAIRISRSFRIREEALWDYVKDYRVATECEEDD